MDGRALTRPAAPREIILLQERTPAYTPDPERFVQTSATSGLKR